MKSLLILALFIFAQAAQAERVCREIGSDGNCEWIEVNQVDSLEIKTEKSGFDLFSPSTWFSSNDDKATREVRGGGNLQADPGFDPDEKNAPKRNIPDPGVLKKEKFRTAEERMRDSGMSTSQMALLKKHEKLINDVANADAQARNEISQMNSGLRNIDQELAPLDKSIEAASKEYDRCVQEQRECTKSKAALLNKLAQIETIRESRGPIVKNWNTSMKRYNDKLDEFESHTLKLNKEMRPYMTDEGMLRQQVANLQIDLKREEVTRQFNDVRYNLVETSHHLDMLELEYDTQRIGAYVQDKMGHLLTSDILCKVTTKCVGGDNQSNLVKGDLVEIFPNIERNNNAREGYSKRRSPNRTIQSVE